MSADELNRIQFEQLKKIVSFAFEKIPFYRDKYKQAFFHPTDLKHPDDIHKIPILTKSDIRHAFNGEEITGRRNHRRSTSGSSGDPLVFYKDNTSMAIMDAILYRNYSWFGVDIGDRQARFWGRPIRGIAKLKTNAMDTLINRIRLPSFELYETHFQKILRKMEQTKPSYIYGYAQIIYQFANYFFKKGIDLSYLKLKCVILTAEMSYANQRNIIQSVFQCPVTEEYGCTELGVIGFRCQFGSMHLTENLYIEQVTSAGRKFGNLIISELYGNLFPFIRYQIGDQGQISNRQCQCGRNLRILEKLVGRQDKFIQCPGGKLVDGYVLEYIIDQIPRRTGSIHKFRIIQKKINSIEVILVGDGDQSKLQNFILQEFPQYLEPDMKITINFSDDIPPHPSGKQSLFVSLIE